MTITAPQTEAQLLQRAQGLAGQTVASIAKQLDIAMPDNLRRDKGWLGQLLEVALGADARTLQAPDFSQLGIELKTIPISAQGKPFESTFITTITLLEMGSMTWHTSNVFKKLARVLWVPIVSEPSMTLAERIIATPLLWSPSPEQEATLENDWQEHSDKIAMGQIATITARQGVYLQVRPKAANSKVLCEAWGEDGEKIQTLPRGFYLRPKFTEQLLQENFV